MKSNDIPVSHFLRTRGIPTSMLGPFFEHCAKDGVRHLSLTSEELELLPQDPERCKALQCASRASGIRFLNAHAPYGEQWDLNCSDPIRRTVLPEEHKRRFELCASFGLESITMHIGTNDSGRPLFELRSRVRESLAELLPEAETFGLIIAVENTLFPTDTPEELLAFLAEFDRPSLGICFDSGHANLMDASPGKQPGMMVEWIRRRWENSVHFQNDTLSRLLPHVVTCHLHDNHGFDDEHLLAGEGTIDWSRLLRRLRTDAPRLRSFQNEANMSTYGISPGEAVNRFKRLMSSVAEELVGSQR